ncbi:MAG: MOSC domain-containing protein [Rhizobiaceae bacterium]
MQLTSVNIAKAERLAQKTPRSKTAALTGIYKRPVSNAVFITKLGPEGDVIVDKEHHGGVDQAVYLYSTDDYQWWQEKLGRPVEPGLFGENLTISGIESASVCVGDLFQINDVVMEVTSPRIPCSTLSARMADTKFAKTFMDGERPGIYCRVLKEGTVKTGDVISYEKYTGQKINLREMFKGYPFKTITQEDRQRYLSVPAHWKVLAFLRGEREKA